MKRLFLRLAIVGGLLSSLAFACGQTRPAPDETYPVQKPFRHVDGQILKSSQLPAVRLQFDPAFKYVGTQSFVLYEVANAEQHFFVDADAGGRIKRMYWIQFEGYLPTNNLS